MRKAALICAVALLPMLGGCALLQKFEGAIQSVGAVTVPGQDIVVTVKAFNIVERLATEYVNLPRCDGVLTICRTPAITRQVTSTVRKGRAARDDLLAFYKTHPGQLGPQGAMDALNAAISTVQKLVADNTGAAK